MLAHPAPGTTPTTVCVATAEKEMEAAFGAVQATRLTSPSHGGNARQRLRAAVLEATRGGAPLRVRGTR
jgi:hypothetical protein